MFAVLRKPTYRKLFLAQVLSLFGSGLTSVALGLLAYELAGGDAGMVLGTALALKMVAYVGVAPIAAAVAAKLPRKPLLVGLDLFRTATILVFPFITEVWQIYVLIFVLQAASAAFTPAFQALIPEVLPEEDDYTAALALSRLAYDLESLISPLTAATLLLVIGFQDLFVGTAVGFLLSAALVASAKLPAIRQATLRPFRDRLTRGLRIFVATPRLRALMALNGVVASAGAMVIVNTVVYVQHRLGLGADSVATALASFGGGSMMAALMVTRLLEHLSERNVMLGGGLLLITACGLATLGPPYQGLLLLWAMMGAGFSLAQVPAGRLLKRSAHAEDRPAVFAAQFALSHACWLISYPLAGWAGVSLGLEQTALLLALLATGWWVLSLRAWPHPDPEVVLHAHPELSPDHPHLASGAHGPDHRHSHPLVIDDLHSLWPSGRP